MPEGGNQVQEVGPEVMWAGCASELEDKVPSEP